MEEIIDTYDLPHTQRSVRESKGHASHPERGLSKIVGLVCIATDVENVRVGNGKDGGGGIGGGCCGVLQG